MKSKFVQYYVEGDDEKKIINVLKSDLKVIRPGKVQKLNVVTQKITYMRIRTLAPGTMVVFVFDTDRGEVDMLKENIETVKACPSVSEIILIPQVPNMEEELVRSCNIKKIEDLLNSKSRSEFKSDLIRVSNLDKKLLEHQFDIKLFWCGIPAPPYQDIENRATKVKIV